MSNFIVIRIANKADGSLAVPSSGHETQAAAEKEFFRQCGTAVDSAHPMDAVMLVTKEGFCMRHEAWEHEVTPEPVEE